MYPTDHGEYCTDHDLRMLAARAVEAAAKLQAHPAAPSAVRGRWCESGAAALSALFSGTSVSRESAQRYLDSAQADMETFGEVFI